MSHYLSVVPFPGILLALLAGFVVGAISGFYYGRSRPVKEKVMSTSARSTAPSRFRAWYDKVAPALVLICILTSMFASIGVFAQNSVNNRQDSESRADQKSRTADNSALIKCVDAFAAQLAGGLPPVRAATAARDAALRAALGPTGLEGTLVKLSKNEVGPTDVQALIAALEAYQAAETELSQTRKENPYPPPPSQFCTLPSASR